MEDPGSMYLNKQAFIFGNIFLLANKLQVISDQYLAESGLTTKQWFLIAVIQQFHDTPPTLSQVSELIGSSRQNVKQLAIKLEGKGFLRIDKDVYDTRAVRLRLTEKCHTFWREREIQDNQFIAEVFNCLEKVETDIIAEGIKKLLKRSEEIIVRKGAVFNEI